MRAPKRRQQILDAALEVFSQSGFHRATMKEIARAAGLRSPALIYWYFPNKSALFRAVLQRLAPMLTHLVEDVSLLDQPPEEALPRFARAYLHTFSRPEAVRLLRVVVAEAMRSPEANTALADSGLLTLIRFLEEYFRRQVALGRLREHDPRASARAFYGMLNSYALGRSLFPALAEGLPDPVTYVREVVAILLDGLRRTR